MPARLVPLDGTPPIVVARDAAVIVGRARDCAVCIASQWVSRHHCSLTETEDGLFIRELGSVHGTYLNFERVETAILHTHDEVWIGNVRYLVVLEDSTTELVTESDTTWDLRRIPPNHAGSSRD